MAIMVTRGRGRDESSHGGNVQVLYVLARRKRSGRSGWCGCSLLGRPKLGSFPFFLYFSFCFHFLFLLIGLSFEFNNDSNDFRKF